MSVKDDDEELYTVKEIVAKFMDNQSERLLKEMIERTMEDPPCGIQGSQVLKKLRMFSILVGIEKYAQWVYSNRDDVGVDFKHCLSALTGKTFEPLTMDDMQEFSNILQEHVVKNDFASEKGLDRTWKISMDNPGEIH